MQTERRIVCGNVGGTTAADDLRFHLHGEDDDFKVTLKIEDIRRNIYSEVPERFHDLLEIATYVYCADQAWPRGQRDAETFGANWRRQFHFVIAVSDTDFWNSAPVKACLAETLGFLSDDEYEFEFVGDPGRPSLQGFLKFSENGDHAVAPERVMLFSGGLDSLGGAVETVVSEKKRAVLVNHRSSSKLDRMFDQLVKKLAARAPECPAPYHVRVTVHKQKWMNKEYTQRSRSFLFASLGATIARMFGQDSIHFYENGVLSMNLPIAAQVVGGKATRTTHPRVIAGFRQLLSLVAGTPFKVETPFIWKTKGEVVSLIGQAGCQDMIGDSISCTHTWEITTAHPQCGTCSQCLDRRFAVLAAGMEQHDPLDRYKVDVFTGSRNREDYMIEDKTLYASYIERANEVAKVHDALEFMIRFPEAAKAVMYLPGSADSVSSRMFDMYRRHSTEVTRVLEKMFSLYAPAIIKRTHAVNSLLRVIFESHLPVSAAAVAADGEWMPDNVFRRRGDGWQVRYNGRREFTLESSRGADYLCRLLAAPGRDLQTIDMACGAAILQCDRVVEADAVAGEGLQSSSRPMVQGLGHVADHRAVKEYRAEACRLLDEVDEARQAGDDRKVAKLERDIALIAAQVSAAVGLGGKLKPTGDKRKSIRDGFRNAVNRTIRKIKETDRPFAGHLQETVKFGRLSRYQPDEDLSWEVRAVINE